MIEVSILTAVSLTVVHHPSEDRMALNLTAHDGTQLALMLTRRLAIRLVNGFAHLLERTSPAAAEAPLRARSDIVMFEHQGALATGGDAAGAPSPTGLWPALPRTAAAPTQTGLASLMLEAMDITVTLSRFVVTLKSGGRAVARTEVTRSDLHQLLALLRRKCDEAAWRVPMETAWLDFEAGSMTLN